ncbi:MAG: non-ribosomal peptide synthetase, partial [Segetibacter sp.]
ATYPLNKSVIDLFEEQVLQTPDATALIFEEEQISFSQLNRRANRLAYELRGKGVKEETLVPLCIDRSVEMIAGMLGILKACGAYVSIDAEYPGDRIAYMLEDSGSNIVVTARRFSNAFAAKAGREVVFADDYNKEEAAPLENLIRNYTTDDPVTCIIYTSGSSGTPKGVRVGNRGIVNRMYWMWNEYPFTKNERFALKTSIGFGDHIWEVFGPLTRGVTGVIFKKEDLLDLDILLDKLSVHKITRWALVPSLLRAIISRLQTEPAALPDLKYWTSSGEALSGDLIEAFYQVFPASSHKLLNIYGSCEVSADATFYDTSIHLEELLQGEHADQKKMPIGKPISNCSVYILDKEGNLLPTGVAGEICVGGVPVAHGYLNRPDLTAEKFADDPYAKQAGAKMYRTGDLGRWLPDGNIEYLGRIDDQVKIRGYRIELGEIETVLQLSALVHQAVVAAKNDQEGNKRLVAYIIPEGTFDKAAITSYLQSKLPEYMVPALLMEMKSLPLTATGKTDRKALPNPDVTELLTNRYTAPRNEAEAKLVQIWKDL